MPLTEDQQNLLAEIARAHPDWDSDRVKAEFYRRIIEASPAYIKDSHVFPGKETEEGH